MGQATAQSEQAPGIERHDQQSSLGGEHALGFVEQRRRPLAELHYVAQGEQMDRVGGHGQCFGLRPQCVTPFAEQPGPVTQVGRGEQITPVHGGSELEAVLAVNAGEEIVEAEADRGIDLPAKGGGIPCRETLA